MTGTNSSALENPDQSDSQSSSASSGSSAASGFDLSATGSGLNLASNAFRKISWIRSSLLLSFGDSRPGSVVAPDRFRLPSDTAIRIHRLSERNCGFGNADVGV
jgi:hypothetical protein